MRIATLIFASTLASSLGCKAEVREVAPEEPPKPATAVATCARQSPAREKALDTTGSSANVALVARDGRTLAFVADADDGSIHTVDVDMATELANTPVDGAPAALIVLADGRLAVSFADRARVELFEAPLELDKPLEHRCSAPVAVEPTGLALTPDGETLLVASRWGHTLTALASKDLAARFTVDLPRDPRAVVTSSDGTKAFVAHVVGSRVSVVDLEGERKVRTIDLHDRQVRQIVHLDMGESIREFHENGKAKLQVRDQRADQGFSILRAKDGKILAPEAMVDPGNGVRSHGYGETRSAFGDVAAILEKTEKRARKPAFDSLNDDCLLPRSAAVDVEDNKLVVACAGIDAIVVYGSDKAAPHDKELRRYEVPAGPTGVAVDDKHRAVVWSEHDRSMTILDLRRGKGDTSKRFALGAHALHTTAAAVRGRALFHMSGGGRVAFDGRSCASCHPDGRDDAVTWTTPDGPRQTPMLVGRLAETAPYGWAGTSNTLGEHLKHTFDRLAGKGLTPSEQEDLFAYIATLRTPGEGPRPPSPETRSARADGAEDHRDPLVLRGDALFHSEEAGCSSCHLGDLAADHAKHDVKSRAPGDAISAFDTPSLRFVGSSAPYYHDGRFATLGELLTKTEGKMGHTKQLSKDDREALVAFLQSL